jgi:predicted unusual protein kinase regulating ubiquinone biosynthesis (AarF/ABC1/UbiB family)
LRDLVIAVGTRDMDRLITAYQAMGVLLPGADLERLRQAETALFESMWGKNMTELIQTHPQEMRRFASEFRDLLYEMPFQLPADLLFLGRCVAILSGMCTGLNPAFNLFEGLQPFAERLLSDEGGDWLTEILQILSEQGRSLLGLPLRIDRTLARLERGDLIVTARAAPGLERQLSLLTAAIQRLVATGIFAALLIAGSLLYTAGERTGGWICFILSLLILLWTLLVHRRRP